MPMRYVFTAPDVEPAIPPKNINATITTWRAGLHMAKSAVAKPVVVRIDTTVNVASARASPRPNSAASPPATITTPPQCDPQVQAELAVGGVDAGVTQRLVVEGEVRPRREHEE